MLREWVPALDWVPRYERRWLPRDVVAGLVLVTLLVPQGMAYAQLAGLPPITGLYTTVLCLLGYAVFGPSRVLVLGPDSSLGPMIAAVVVPIAGADGDPARAVALASMLGLLVGVTMVAAGALRLGFVADLLSRPTQIGYMNGLALTILVSQLPKLLGFSVDADGVVGEAFAVVRGILDGRTVLPALAVGAAAFVVIVGGQRLAPKAPTVLLGVLLGIGATVALDLGDRGVRLVGALPQGFPPLSLPAVSLSDVGLLVAGALGITLVSLADTISTASAYARRAGAQVRGNNEIVGIGAANVLSGLFQGFPVSTSGSRTAVAFAAGARTQLTGVVGAVAIVVLLVAAPGLLADLPQPVLGAVVLAASLSMADLPGLRRLWRQRPVEFWLAVTAFAGVALFGVLPGIAVAVGLSILNVFRRAWWPYQTVLGNVADLPGYHDVRSYPEAERLPGAVIFRFDAPLFFANARVFREQVERLAAAQPRPHWIIVAAEPVTDVDTTAADMLRELDRDLDAAGTRLVFAELKDPVRAKVERYGLADAIEAQHFFPTIKSAVRAYKEKHGVDWQPVTGATEPPDGQAPPGAGH
ncbi:SulP family inorganic anion transporter [Kineosporia sp. A_224]|uniref:SulP family inorganic anion transporter n=1 Tax=Kineosporia sp. A_224 TaxID=1962180 RepID=UPI000B4B5682|nr:sulfate permease [Kineosporia sp. A_224]